MKKGINKNDRGITLIALIVTIIILIILVAVTIKAIAGDNLIDIAEGATTNYLDAEKSEENMFNSMSITMKSIFGAEDEESILYCLGSIDSYDIASLCPTQFQDFTTDNFIVTSTWGYVDTHQQFSISSKFVGVDADCWSVDSSISYNPDTGLLSINHGYRSQNSVIDGKGWMPTSTTTDTVYLYTGQIENLSTSIQENTPGLYKLDTATSWNLKTYFKTTYQDFTQDNFIIKSSFPTCEIHPGGQSMSATWIGMDSGGWTSVVPSLNYDSSSGICTLSRGTVHLILLVDGKTWTDDKTSVDTVYLYTGNIQTI